MTASIGVWAQGETTGEVVLYRWEADQRSGFVTFEVSIQEVRAADGRGRAIGQPADGVDRRLVVQVAAAIRRAYRRAGKAPETAHAYYY
jgi:hypothetical protein